METEKKAREILKKKYPNKLRLIESMEKINRIPRDLEEEYKIIFDQELKKNEEKEKVQKISIIDETEIASDVGKESLKKELEEKNQKIEELTDTLKRLQAEFENYKKWNAKEKTEFVKYAHADIIEKMLPVLDSFEIALKSTSDGEKFTEGMKMIYAQLYSMLEALGLKPIKAAGEKFDPYRHEVLMKEESDKPEDTILEEFQKGYMLNDRVLRHSKVKVSGK